MVKEIGIGPNISSNDEQHKIKKILELLAKEHHVKINMLFKGRMITHEDIGMEKLMSIVRKIEESKLGKMSSPPKMNGKRLSVTINFRKIK